jgi:RecA/RadA recombinase
MPKKKVEATEAPKKGTGKKTKVPKKAEAAPTPKKGGSAVAEWYERINKDKKFQGKAQIKMASEVKTPYHLRRPTGVLGLDIGLGGGFPAGGLIVVHGAESVGKTWLAYVTAGQLQKNYGEDANIFMLAVEIRPDKSFARMAEFCIAYSNDEIVEYDALRQAQGQLPFTEEDITDLKKQVGNVVVVSADNAQTGLDVLVDALESGIFQIAIIESLGALLTPDVEEGSVGDKHYAGTARLLTQFQNKVGPLYIMDRPDGSMLETTIFGIDQARANIGAGKYDPDTKAAIGAYAWKHGQLVAVELDRGATIREDPSLPPTGRTVKWKLTKGKVGTHDGLRGDYDYHHLPKVEPVFWRDVETTWFGGIALFDEMVVVAKKLEVATVGGSWVTWGERRYNGMSKFAQAVAEDAELAAELRAECLKKAGILARYR